MDPKLTSVCLTCEEPGDTPPLVEINPNYTQASACSNENKLINLHKKLKKQKQTLCGQIESYLFMLYLQRDAKEMHHCVLAKQEIDTSHWTC